jgi:hypothetical protein
MIICDLHGGPKRIVCRRNIEGKEYDICSEAWNPFRTKAKGERPKEGPG